MRLRRAAALIGLTVVIAVAVVGCSAAKPSTADVDAYLKARDLYLRGSVDQAGAVVSHIDSRRGPFHQARLLEGKVLFFKGNMVEAEKVFRGLMARRAGYTEAQIWLLRTLQAQGKTTEAEGLLNSELELNPGDPRLLQLAGMLRLNANDINGALGFFRRAQDYGTEFAQSYVESARVLYRFGMADAALTDLAVAQALLPTDSDMRKPVNDLMARIREAKK